MLRLTQKEREIFHCTQLQVGTQLPEIRKRTGYRDHTIRYCLQRALDRRMLVRRCFLNLHLLGYTQYEVYFSIAPEAGHCREALLHALAETENISWVGELGGDFQFGLNLCARHAGEVSELFDGLSQKFGAIFLDKAIAIRTGLRYFGNQYLATQSRAVECLLYEPTQERVKIDEIDHKILAALMDEVPASRRELARRVAMPHSTIEYRLKRLENTGVIVGYYYYIDATAITMQSLLVLVSLKSLEQSLRNSFIEFCSAHPNISVLVNCIGSWDFEIVVEVDEARLVTDVTQELNVKFGQSIHGIKVLPLFRYLKIREYPFRSFDPDK